MVDIDTGMLTPAEADVLIAASKGTALLQTPPQDLAAKCPQAFMLMYYLQDTLSNRQILISELGREYTSVYDLSTFVVVIVNALDVPLTLRGDLNIWAGTQYGRPVDHTDPANPIYNQVPAAKEENPGFAVWMVSNSGGSYGTTFSMSFQADPVFWPCAMSLGFQADYTDHGPNIIRIMATDDPQTAQNDAYYNRNGAGVNVSAVWSGVVNSQNATISEFASLQQPDGSRTYLAIVSVLKS